jgi:hypothetical protein
VRGENHTSAQPGGREEVVNGQLPHTIRDDVRLGAHPRSTGVWAGYSAGAGVDLIHDVRHSALTRDSEKAGGEETILGR